MHVLKISSTYGNVRRLFTNLQSVQEILHYFESIDILTLSETYKHEQIQ